MIFRMHSKVAGKTIYLNFKYLFFNALRNL